MEAALGALAAKPSGSRPLTAMPNSIWKRIMANAASRASELAATFLREAEQVEGTSDAADACSPV